MHTNIYSLLLVPSGVRGRLSQEEAAAASELWSLCQQVAEETSDMDRVINLDYSRKHVFLCQIHLTNPKAAAALHQSSGNPLLKLNNPVTGEMQEMALIPFKLTAQVPCFLCLPFPKVRPAINLVICGPGRLRGFQRLLLAQPRLPTLWDVLCEVVEMVHDEGDALWKRLSLLPVYHAALRAGKGPVGNQREAAELC